MKHLLIVLIVWTSFSSCRTQRQFTYFRDIPDTISHYRITDTGYKVLTIKPDDVLQVNISSPNPEASSFFNTQGGSVVAGPVGSGATNSGTPAPNSYLVDKEGGIDLPIIGRIEVKGLTTGAVKEAVKNKVAPYLKDPIVSVRLQNFKVTVLGEVTRPANYIVPNERVSLLDAIGMAGDLTVFGRRENVLLIREVEGEKTFTRLNLNDSKVFSSQYYYLQQNDILYVEPNKARAAATDMTTLRTISIVSSLATLAAVIISRL